MLRTICNALKKYDIAAYLDNELGYTYIDCKVASVLLSENGNKVRVVAYIPSIVDSAMFSREFSLSDPKVFQKIANLIKQLEDHVGKIRANKI
jgi:hypothetical protein